MEKALIYARQSFGQEEGSVSIEVQLEACRKWAQAHNVTIVGEFSDPSTSSELYPACDEGIEAARIDRGFQMWKREQLTKGRKEYKEGLGRAFDAIKTSRPDYLVVYTSNRLGRSATNSNLNNFLNAYLMEHNCSIVDVLGNSITDFSDKLMMAFRAMKDALDYQGLAEKRKASIESVSRRINSYRKWSNAFGVKMVDGQVTFLPECAEAVRLIFNRLVAGASYASILKTLNSPEHIGLWEGRQCYQSTLNNIIRNPVYCGFMVNREGTLGRAVNIPEPPVSYSVWNEAQDVADSKKANAGKYNLKGQKRRHWLPLSGYVRCSCGRRMQMFIERGEIIYRCICPDHVRRIKVSDEVLKTIQCVFIKGALESRRRLSELSKASERVDAIKARLARLEASMRAKLALVETDEDIAIYEPVLRGTKKEIAEARQELLEAQALDADEEKRLEEQCEEDFHSLMEQELLGEEHYQRLLRQTIDHLTVTDDALTVHLNGGGEFAIPRLLGAHRARRLMKCTITADTVDETISGLCHYTLYFFDGEPTIAGGREVYDDGLLTVYVH